MDKQCPTCWKLEADWGLFGSSFFGFCMCMFLPFLDIDLTWESKPKPKPRRTKVKPVDEVRITPQKKVRPTKNVDDAIPAKITISADISAKIFIDGKLIGPAPIINKQISPGKHSVQLAPVSGGIKDRKKFTIDVKPGKTMIYQWSFNDERWLRKD